LDLSACDREPIHTPGIIQSHGVLIATGPGSGRVHHVSANIEASTGLAAAAVLNARLEDVLGPSAVDAIERALSRDSGAPTDLSVLTLPFPVDPNRSVMVHRHLGRTIVELTAPIPADGNAITIARVQAMISSLSRTGAEAELCAAAAREIRQLTGYDRVMVYRFDAEGHGTVVAEELAAELEPFLNLHYPASDIPQQARRLYVAQRVRVIPDVLSAPTSLLAEWESDTPLDMTHCTLRGVSPVHIEYLCNMGVRSTLSISILRDGALWGMVLCHHGAPMVARRELRQVSEFAGELLSVLLHKVSEAGLLRERLGRHRTVVSLQSQLEAAEDLGEALTQHASSFLDLLGAGGALISVGASTTVIGEAPPVERAVALVAALRGGRTEDMIVVSDAGRPGSVAADCPDVASGVLVAPILHTPGFYIAWFRPEQVRDVRWGGDPNKPTQSDEQGRLSPRTSFAAWAEEVRGRSDAWTSSDLEAATEVSGAVTSALLSKAEFQLANLAAFDPLTGLPNRRSLQASLDGCAAEGSHSRAAMLFLDLDRFKAINDSLGHSAGDQVLRQLATRLQRITPPGAVAGRLGGDEFLIFLPGAGPAEAEALSSALMRELRAPFVLGEHRHFAAASIGIACCPVSRLDDLMREADEAMYAAKRAGGGRSAHFQPSHHATVLSAMQIEQDLFTALEKQELTIAYQPIYNITNDLIVGLEALLRWRHPVKGLIPPSEFIPIAEQTGLIMPIGEWVLGEAVRHIAVWRRSFGHLTISVNVSGRQLMDGSLSELLGERLEAEKLTAGSICLEVTESVLMDNTAVAELHRLRAMGVKVAIDDFGTGYSSLAYLLTLPVDIVKIDRRFITPLGSDPKADQLFHAVVGLLRTLDLEIVAEGCESLEQWRVVRASDCEGLQGWIVSKALPFGEVIGFLESFRPEGVFGPRAGP
jgi:diguanylate cyclase (GGDEF)-like protein